MCEFSAGTTQLPSFAKRPAARGAVRLSPPLTSPRSTPTSPTAVACHSATDSKTGRNCQHKCFMRPWDHCCSGCLEPSPNEVLGWTCSFNALLFFCAAFCHVAPLKHNCFPQSNQSPMLSRLGRQPLPCCGRQAGWRWRALCCAYIFLRFPSDYLPAAAWMHRAALERLSSKAAFAAILPCCWHMASPERKSWR